MALAVRASIKGRFPALLITLSLYYRLSKASASAFSRLSGILKSLSDVAY